MLPLSVAGLYAFLFSSAARRLWFGDWMPNIWEAGYFPNVGAAPVRTEFTYIPVIDFLLRVINAFFYEFTEGITDPHVYSFTVWFFVGVLGPFLGVWVLETNRRDQRYPLSGSPKTIPLAALTARDLECSLIRFACKHWAGAP
jgi:hypothetical protein